MPPLLASLLLAATSLPSALANLELFTQKFTADPAPLVHDGRVYIYTSHDLSGQRGWLMVDYACFSSVDLVNWTDEGIVFTMENATQTWGVYAWAQQVVLNPNTGLFTMAFPGMNKRAPPHNQSGTGIATSASPTGPFVDAIGEPLIACGDDPTMFIDDDGTIVLCGNCGGALCGVLNADMRSFKAPPALLSPPLPIWFEAPWLSKIDGTYFLSYMCQIDADPAMAFNYSHGGWDICYGSAAALLGPYEFRGSLQWSPPYDCGPAPPANCSQMGADGQRGDNNHQGLFEFPAGSGRHWLAYHTRKLARERGEYVGFQRNVALDRLYPLSAPGTRSLPAGLPWVAPVSASAPAGLLPVTSTPAWVRQAAYLDPFARVLAVTTAGMADGLDSEPSADGGRCLGFVTNGSWTRVAGADFGPTGATGLTLRYATPATGSVVTVVLDGAEPDGAVGGAIIAICALPPTGDWQTWATLQCPLSAPAATAGVHTLRLRFTGAAPPPNGLLNLQWWQFSGGEASGALPPPVSVRARVRSALTGLYWAAPTTGGAGQLVYANASALDAGVYTLSDAEDGTYFLAAPGGGGAFVCVTGAGGAGPLAASAASSNDACARFWLHGTTAGSYALLSAASGKLLQASGSDAPLYAASVTDPRSASGDGARFWVESADGRW